MLPPYGNTRNCLSVNKELTTKRFRGMLPVLSRFQRYRNFLAMLCCEYELLLKATCKTALYIVKACI